MARRKFYKGDALRQAASANVVPPVSIPSAVSAGMLADAPDVPDFWQKGALLNVRPNNEGWRITQYPEEFDWQHPERSIQFTNYGVCQNFVSAWYARESADPRAR